MMVRVLVAVMPTLLEGIIVRALEREFDFRVSLASLKNGCSWVDVASQMSPDVVITTESADDRATEFLLRHPRTKVLALKDDGRQAFLFKLMPERISLGELSPDEIVRTIRSVVE